jgi:hypothetical protein
VCDEEGWAPTTHRSDTLREKLTPSAAERVSNVVRAQNISSVYLL